jgi:hypothetical protein
MVRYQDTLWCDGCGIEITGEPVEKDRLFFCCHNCLDGEDCLCGENDLDHTQNIPKTNDINFSMPQ